MSKLKQKKYIASILIMVIVLGIIGLFSYGKVDKYKGQIKVGKAKLLGSVIDTGLVTSAGTEEVKYNLTYTLDPVEGLERRDVVIKGKLNSPYARFKEIRKSNITSTLINDGQEIEINIEDVRLGEQQNLELIIKVLNAPNKEEITPEISIKEKTGEETRVSGNPIKVETNSIEGVVLDENNLPVSNIELSINKNGREIKRTYTNVEGNYVFSDLEEGEYIIKVEEDIYEIESGEKVTPGDENNKIKVKQVDKYNVETKKYIEKLDLIVNGKENHYTYKDSEKVIQNVKNAKRISGKIEYKIVVRNKSDKQVEIDELEDTPGEGLEFKESENTGWKNKNGKIVYELMEGVSLRGKEKREIKLVLSINDTNEIKTYINKMTSRGEIKEKVVFVIDNKIKREIEVTEGTVIERPNFDIEELDGWYTDSNYTNKYKFTNRVNKDLILYARTNEEKPKYQVRYIDKNEVIKTEEVEEGERTTAPSNPSKRGYTFNCWKNKNSCFNFDTPIEEDVDLISDYQVITYDITYNLRGGTVTGNPDSYTVETNPFTLNNPEKEGYTFIGWTGSNGSIPSLSVSLPDETLEDKEYTANFQINRYQLTIDPKGGEYSGDLLLEEDYGAIVTIPNPEKAGYNFTGWTLTGKGTFNNGIYTFEDGNGKLEANYDVINYDIVYKEITDAERIQLNNPTSYNIETNEFTLNNPANRLNEDNEGEVFVGWKEKNSDTPSMNITLPDRNNLSKKEYTAIWQEREPDKWNITYILNGGTVSGNPTEYKRSQLPITLNNPTKTGYTFKGWTGSNGDTPGNVTIARGTEGDLNYTANYEVNNYTISYDYTSCNLTPEEITALNNRGSYTIEDNNFNLNNPNKYGYVFEGWTGTDLETKTVNVTVDTSKIKNLSYKANCVLDKYDVEFYNMKSNREYELSTTVSDIEYNSSIPSNKIPTVSLRGYTFKYWSLDKTNEYDFNTPVTDNIKLYAVYQKDTYNITYNLDGGTVSGNPDTYSVDTPEFTLNEPSKTGYEFIGWTGSCGDSPLKVVTLPEEELGPKNYVANYKINKYTVTYMNGESKVDDEEVEYNKKATGNVETPTKAHNIFTGWTLNNELYDFDTPVTSNITLYASWEEVEAPRITHTPTTWVRDKVLVTVTSDHTDYTYMYKIGNGTYQSYSEPFEVTENTTIYAYSVKDEINSIEESHEINNIDKINPSINSLEEVGKTPTSVTLNIKGQDLESGLAYIKVYLGSDEVFSTEEYPGNDNDEKEVEVTIGNLEQLTTYTFTIEVIDKVGNTYSEELEVTTPEKHYVARTLEDDGTEIAKYETLREAIESTECVSICNIEMLDNVEETNSVLDGQDIKLDLNGFTITGLQDKAFENNGIFKIVDYNEDEIGKVTSPGTAIVNTGKLTIGENEEPLVVSKTEPIIEGTITGINSPGELYFYDGKIIGGATTGALKGTAPITPYSYNASVEAVGNQEIATLEIIADAEARINSVYYTKVQEAVDASKNGTYTYSDEPTEILKQSKVTSDYGFIYDETTGTLKSNNQGISNSLASGYIYIDTRGEANDKILSIDASISSEQVNNNSKYDIGYIIISNNNKVPNYDQTTGKLMYMYGEKFDNANYLLEKGKEYYLHFGYRKDGSTNSGEDTFTINSIKLADYLISNNNEYKDYLVSEDNNHFKKQQDGSYISNNFIKNSISHSYVKIDLTGIDEEKTLYMDAAFHNVDNCSSWGCSTGGHAYVFVNDSKEMPSYDQEENRVVYSNKNQSRNLFEIPLIPNQVNYVHLGYNFKENTDNTRYYFALYSLKLEDEIVKEHLNSDINRNGTYYMEEIDYSPNIWKDLSINENDGTIINSSINNNNDGFIFDGTSSYVTFSDLPITTEETVEIEYSTTSSGNQVLYQGNSYGNDRVAIGILNGYFIATNRNVSKGAFELPADYNDGNKKKVTVTYNNGEYKMYYNNTELNRASVTNHYYWNNNRNNTLGTRDNSNYFNGIINSVKVYDKSLSSDEIIDTSLITDNLLLYFDASNYKKNLDNPVFINNNQYQNNTIAYSYLTFDLTNLPNKTIYINAEISSELNRDYGFVIVNNSSTAPNYSYGDGRYVFISGEVEAKDYSIPLTGGIVNYVHIGYTKNASVNGGKDTFKINYVKYYADSAETIPVYILSNQTNQKLERTVVLNEEPDTVQIIRNITMTKPLENVETRDVILDLNGYSLTTAADDYVVDNKGLLKIIDSNFNDRLEIAREKYNREQAVYDAEYEEESILYNSFVQEMVDKKHNEKDVVVDFDYTGDVQEFIAPFTGEYTLETWGAQGGTATYGTTPYEGGYGAYSTGKINLTQGDTIYIYVGGQGGGTTVDASSGSADTNTGYNGGGYGGAQANNSAHSGGGGATHIATKTGLLKTLSNNISDILIVSAGGGGASTHKSNPSYSGTGGNGGGIVGNIGSIDTACFSYGMGGTQTSAGGHQNCPGSNNSYGNHNNVNFTGDSGFGFGSNYDEAIINTTNVMRVEVAGGGSGFYGGGSAWHSTGGGGSSYIGNSILTDKHMTCYECTTSDEIGTKTISNTNVSNIAQSDYSKKGNGYARISYVDPEKESYSAADAERDLETYSRSYSYTGSYQIFEAPITARYSVEAWGGSGSVDAYGAYTKGNIDLEQGEKLYIYVGNKWTSGNNKTTFNGGTGNQGGYNGGSSTDIRLVPGDWYDSTSLASRIMVAGAGGSGDGSQQKPGAAGGLVGYNGGGTSGGTQTSVGTEENSEYTSSSFGIANGGCTGGNGYYPGSGASCVLGSGGGSSYISGHKGSVAITSENDITPKSGCETGTEDIECSYHYSGKVFSDTKMIDGKGYKWTDTKSSSTYGMPSIDGTGKVNGNPNAGAVKITIAKPMREQAVMDSDFELTGNISSTTNNTILNEEGAYLNVEQGIINIDKEGTYAGINNRGTLTMGSYSYIYGKKGSNRGIINNSTGDIIEGTGNIVMSGSSNIGILNDSHVDEEIKGYNIKVTNSNSTNFYNRSTIPVIINGMTTGGAGVDIQQNTNTDLIVKNSTLGSTSNESYYSNETSVVSNVTFDNCDIKNRIYNRKNSARTILIKDSTLSGSRGNVTNFGGKVTVTNSSLQNSQGNIQNYSSMEVNNSSLTTTSTQEYYAYNIYNSDYNDGDHNATLTVNDSRLTSNYFNIKNNIGTSHIYNSILNTYRQGFKNGSVNGGWGWSDDIPATGYLNNVTINKIGNEDVNVIYNYCGDLTIDGGRVTTESNNSVAVYNENTGNNNLVIKGNYSNSDNFSKGIYNKLLLTLGDNEDSVSKTYPSINATNSAIYNADTATFNYYDGKIIGIKDNGIDGPINEIPTSYDINITKGDTLETIVLKTGNELVEEEDYVARIGSTNYSTLQSAFDAVSDNNNETEVVLLRDIESAAIVNIPINKNIKFNYNGHTIKTYNKDKYISNNGTLSLVDENNVINNTSYSSYVFENNGILNYNSINSMPIRTQRIINNLVNGSFNINGGEIYSYQTCVINNNGIFNINAGKIYMTKTSLSSNSSDNLIINESSGTLTTNGGEIDIVTSGSAILNKGNVIINNVTFNTSGQYERNFGNFITSQVDSDTKILGGSFGPTTNYGSLLKNGGTAKVKNVTSALQGGFTNSGTLLIEDVVMESIVGNSLNHMTNTGNLTIKDSSIKGTGSFNGITTGIINNSGDSVLNIMNTTIQFQAFYGNIVRLDGNCSASISDSNLFSDSTNQNNASVIAAFGNSSLTSINNNIKVKQTANGYSGDEYAPYGILHNSTGSMVLDNTISNSYLTSVYKKGTGLLTIKSGEYISTNGCGFDTNSASTTIIGEEGGIPSKTSPNIDGKTFGVRISNNDALFNFYDGIISGDTAIQGKINEIEDGYEIILDTDDEEHKYLDRFPIVKNSRTNEEFYTIQDGLDDENIQSGDTLVLLRELTLLPDVEPYTVSATKNVIFDLNGKRINQNNEILFKNYGTFKIMSSENGGRIETYAGMLFDNYNTFTIDNGTYNTTTENIIIKNHENATFTINDGDIYSYETKTIDNDGSLNILGGQLRTTRTDNSRSNNNNMIDNTGTIVISDARFKFIGSGAVINNSGIVTSTDVIVDLYGYAKYGSYGLDNFEYTSFINNNNELSEATIVGGQYGNSNKGGRLCLNSGTLIVRNLDSNLYGSVYNTSTGTATISNVNFLELVKYHYDLLSYGGIYNLGDMSITDCTFNNTNVGKADTILYNGGNIDIKDSLFTNSYNSADIVHLAGTGIAVLDNVNINNTSVNNLPNSCIKVEGSTTVTIQNSDLNISYDDNYDYDSYDFYAGLIHNGTGIVNLINSNISVKKNTAIYMPGTGTLNINSGNYISEKRNGIYNTGTGTINIGVLGGNVSISDPEITGLTYGLYNTNANSTINFYDGIITGNTDIRGSVSSVEPNYEIIKKHNENGTNSKYLDQKPLVKNIRTNEEFDTIQEAISDSEFTNGDTLIVLREYTSLPSYSPVTIPSGIDVIIDMNGNIFMQNMERMFINNGTLKITDSSQSPGYIQTFKNTIIENNGTLTVENIKLYSDVESHKLFINNENAVANLNNIIMTSINYQLIENSGTLNITGGTYKKTLTNSGDQYSENLINNSATGVLNITNATIENRGTSGFAISNNNTLNITGGTLTEKGGYIYDSYSIYTASTGSTHVDGATIRGLYSDGRAFTNAGTTIVENSTITIGTLLYNSGGTVTFTNNTINAPSGHGRNYCQTYNSSVTNFNGNTITSNTSAALISSYNSSIVNINNNTIVHTGGEGIAYASASSTINVDGGSYSSVRENDYTNGLFAYYSDSTGTIENANIDSSKQYAVEMNHNPEVYIDNSIIHSNIDSIVLNRESIIHIDNSSIISNDGIAINMNDTSAVFVGEKGGVPSVNNPLIQGKNYGLYNNSNSASLFFYDGVIKGETGSIYGTITDVEDGYKEKRDTVTDPDTGVTTIDSTLTVVGDTERIAMVGTVNFLSLQSAVNYASNNNIPDIQMFKSVTLDADLVKPDGGANVIIHLNGTTITQGSYTIDPGITLDSGTAPGASVARFLANITGEEINPRNIVIYELEDGSKLEANNTYKLYKEIGGELKIVKVKENEIGDYDLGYDKEILRTTRSRIYINGIGEGTYKLVGSDSKEITFTIYHDGVSSNIRENNNINGNRVSTAVATLILSLQTGMVRNPYILIIMILIVGILGFIALKKNQEYKVIEEDYQE